MHNFNIVVIRVDLLWTTFDILTHIKLRSVGPFSVLTKFDNKVLKHIFGAKRYINVPKIDANSYHKEMFER